MWGFFYTFGLDKTPSLRFAARGQHIAWLRANDCSDLPLGVLRTIYSFS
jgi:hypothetical protein